MFGGPALLPWARSLFARLRVHVLRGKGIEAPSTRKERLVENGVNCSAGFVRVLLEFLHRLHVPVQSTHGRPVQQTASKKLRHLRPVRAPLHLSPCSAVDESLGLEQDILYRELRASVAGRTNGTLRIYSPMAL